MAVYVDSFQGGQVGIPVSAVSIVSLTAAKAAPLLLASLGGLLSESSGVINFALEGMMLIGAFMAVWVAHASGSPWIGLAGGLLGGMAIGFLHSVVSLKFRANQIVSSIALNLLAAGVAGMLLNEVFGVYGTSPSVAGLPTTNQALASVFSKIGIAGEPEVPLIGGMSVLVPLAVLLGLAVMAFIAWSTTGLHIRACGENPHAARAAGLPVTGIRFLAVVAGGGLAGLGGAFLSIGELSQFVERMTHGRGYLAIAALILGRWRPAGVLAAVLVFGFGQALSEWLAVRWTYLPDQVFLVFPYAVCLSVLVVRIGSKRPPSALGRL